MNVKLLCSTFVIAMALLSGGVRAQTGTTATANPELVGALAKALNSTPQQAEGAAGLLFGHARSKLSATDWASVSGAVPGMDGLLKAAPAGPVGTSGVKGALGSLAGATGVGGSVAGLAESFGKLGLKPEMIATAIPILTNYVSKSAGPAVGQLLGGALK